MLCCKSPVCVVYEALVLVSPEVRNDGNLAGLYLKHPACTTDHDRTLELQVTDYSCWAESKTQTLGHLFSHSGGAKM
jgi:hypothetical protein